MTTDLSDFAHDINALFSAFDRPDSPGAVLLVRHHGQEVFCNAWGAESLTFGRMLTRRSVIRIGSQSKQFTVLLALMLEAEGKLSMSDPVQKHFPELPVFDHPVTLYHLATNTSGWRDHFQALVLSGISLYAPSTRQATRDRIARQEALNFAPGSALSYSNSGFVLLSDLIEKIEGKPLGDVLKERIFDPLGMADTLLVGWDGLAVPGLASHYCTDPEGWFQRNWGLPIGGEGGIASTVDDTALWLDNFDTARIGTAEMLARMQTPPHFPGGQVSGYGMGLVIHDYRGRRFVGHGGSVAGGRSENGRFVDDGLSVVLLGNCDTVEPLATVRRVADLWFGDAEPPVMPFKPGRYRQDGGRDVLVVRDHAGGKQMMSAGTVFERLDCTPPEGAAREAGLISAHYRPTDTGIAADYCGVAQTYTPVPDDAQAARPLTGRYRQDVQGFDVAIDTDLRQGRFLLTSDQGVFRGHLAAVDRDLWILRAGEVPKDGPPARAVPWMAALQAVDGGFVLDTARNKGLTFKTTEQ
ncbi:serine hydrolase domain-containing protein [Chachezhania sediminis]|uniref:serine hydrolase domain-containing protein n=1 Tax=Chachezhania sediminis TaxID=2599291 RepID=UPI00131B5A91|nr:serine hydrolase domain-containing protein [Chachezhania sediminis]